MYILSAQLDDPGVDWTDPARSPFRIYDAYLAANAHRFPPNAYALATGDWWYDHTDHRCPHDGWLESAVIREPSKGKRHEIRKTMLRVRLLGAYHDGHLELIYRHVFRYRMDVTHAEGGHGDWRYDEFRVSDDGHLVHEIEWADAGTWLIEAKDIEHRWIPFDRPSAAPSTDRND